ncbi:MAG: hypothetical protein JRF56_20515 [Deltaproteobacteria bacterium]|jgi:hypothetical protein|nr:hypothetical protein [Deltaproteobacteria bacterium]
MKKTDEEQLDTSKLVSKTSALDLKGRQSVRATFRLSEDCIDAISILLLPTSEKNMRGARNC